MSETKRKRIELETTAKGDRLWLSQSRCKRIIAAIEDMRLIAKYAEDGELHGDADMSRCRISEVAAAYGLIEPETVSDDAEPETPEDTAHKDAEKRLAEQSPVVTG